MAGYIYDLLDRLQPLQASLSGNIFLGGYDMRQDCWHGDDLARSLSSPDSRDLCKEPGAFHVTPLFLSRHGSTLLAGGYTPLPPADSMATAYLRGKSSRERSPGGGGCCGCSYTMEDERTRTIAFRNLHVAWERTWARRKGYRAGTDTKG